MALLGLCAPALIYLVFSLTQILIDVIQGMYNTAFLKMWVALVFTILLNFLCKSGLGIISWFIVFIPFILMTVIVAMLLLLFGLDPRTGKVNMYSIPPHHRRRRRYRDARREERDRDERRDGDGKRDGRPVHFNEGRDVSDISDPQRKVLDDDVRTRTHLPRDPIQY